MTSMNPLANNQGQGLVETVLLIPIFLGLLFFAIEYSFVHISKRITTWGCYHLARSLLPVEKRNEKQAYQEAITILEKIPFRKKVPLFNVHSVEKEVTVEVIQTISLLGRSYDIKEKVTLYR